MRFSGQFLKVVNLVVDLRDGLLGLGNCHCLVEEDDDLFVTSTGKFVVAF
jgi:hypothetical protein